MASASCVLHDRDTNRDMELGEPARPCLSCCGLRWDQATTENVFANPGRPAPIHHNKNRLQKHFLSVGQSPYIGDRFRPVAGGGQLTFCRLPDEKTSQTAVVADC